TPSEPGRASGEGVRESGRSLVVRVVAQTRRVRVASCRWRRSRADIGRRVLGAGHGTAWPFGGAGAWRRAGPVTAAVPADVPEELDGARFEVREGGVTGL